MFNADQTLAATRWPIVRLRGGNNTEIVLLSPRFFQLTTHWNKCTLPCPGEDCRLCEMLPSRGLFYAACMCNSRVSILELGSQSASYFEQHAKLLHGGMQAGQVYELTRRGDKSPVHSEILRTVDKAKEITMIDLATHVMTLFKFPIPQPMEELEDYELRCRHIAKVRCDRAADVLSSARDRRVN